MSQTFQNQLLNINACPSAVAWVGDKDLETAWATCERSDWMLWLAAKARVDKKTLVLAACDCANTAWPYCDDETLTAVMLCDHITREWCAGREDIETVGIAAAYAAAYDNAYDNAYAKAANTAAYAAAYAAYADSAVVAANTAAYAAAYAAYAADANAAKKQTQKQCADLVRARIPLSTIKQALGE